MIGQAIRKQRQAAGMTQKELAEAAFLTQPYISQLESGARDNPPIETLESIATALAVDVAKLIKAQEAQTA